MSANQPIPPTKIRIEITACPNIVNEIAAESVDRPVSEKAEAEVNNELMNETCPLTISVLPVTELVASTCPV